MNEQGDLTSIMVEAGAQAIRVCNPVGAAQTAETVIENAIEAVGGIVRWSEHLEALRELQFDLHQATAEAGENADGCITNKAALDGLKARHERLREAAAWVLRVAGKSRSRDQLDAQAALSAALKDES